MTNQYGGGAVGRGGKATTDLTEGPVFKILLTFSLPIIASNILHTGYNLVDMAIVGRYLGSVGLSAVSVVSDILNVILLASNGMSNAAQVVIAQYTGARDRTAVNKSAGTIFSVVMLCSLAVTVLMIGFHVPILKMMNVPEEAWNDAVYYSITCYLGIIFTFGYGVLAALLRGMGDVYHGGVSPQYHTGSPVCRGLGDGNLWRRPCHCDRTGGQLYLVAGVSLQAPRPVWP